MIFYLTGPDHSGKSTLANFIVKLRNANYIHSTYNKEWDMKEYHENIKNMALVLNNEYNQDVVLDRWCLDAFPYRFVNKGNTYNPKDLWNEFLHEIGNDLILIYCKPTGEFDSNKREEMFNESDMTVIESEFDKLFDIFDGIEHYTYSYIDNGSDMESFINDVIKDYLENPKDYEWRNDIESKESVIDEKVIDYGSIPRVVACDFDDTLVKNGFPNLSVRDEDINWDMVNKLKDEVKNGSKLVLWTNRTGEALEDAVKFSNEVLGLVYDAINDNVEEVKVLGLNPRKVWADVFYDDKAITVRF